MKYLFLLLLSTICLANEPKFHYGEKVIIKNYDDFYKDCIGHVINYDRLDNYTINIDFCNNYKYNGNIEISEIFLKLIK